LVGELARDSESHWRPESSDKIHVLEDCSVASSNVNELFCEDVKSVEHFRLVHAVLGAHTIQIGGRVITPAVLWLVSQLGELLGVVGIVQAIPCEVVAEHVQNLSLV